MEAGIAWPETHDNLTNMESWRRGDVPVLPGSGPAPRLHDTASGELVLAAAGPVATLYACGITPYDATHMGHAATYTAWDLLVRAWLDAAPETPTTEETPGRPARYTVVYVQNVTDVDDPLIERAERDGEDWRELARRETQRYREDMEALRVLPPTHLIGAVEALPVIERFTARMADRGALYNVDEDVYFARSADPGFGSLSGPGTACGYGPAEMAELAAERGGDPDRPGKKDPLDVLVWRAERPGEPAWDSRFGRGRPGWHVECAAIATEYLGNSFDVQAGGSDLVFPHHEMSASHARVALSPADHPFARVYVHAGMVSYDGEKMSKSLGNLVFVSKLLADGVDPMAIRMALLAHHYRSDWEWTERRPGRRPGPAGPLAGGPGPRRSRRSRSRHSRRGPGGRRRDGAVRRARADARRPRRPWRARHRGPLGRHPGRRAPHPHHRRGPGRRPPGHGHR